MQAVDQMQRLFVRAEQDVLAVIERPAFELDRARTSTQGPAGLVERDRHPGFGQRQCGSTAGPAAADDRDPGLA
jgi:hypothetical protein